VKVRQCDFEFANQDGSTAKQTAWVDASWRLKVGIVVTFKGDDRRWKLTRLGNSLMDVSEINNSWEVGGL
jgi:hypothetical protein